ncbi:MAG: (E)-4-hydroxy-3-methylbut-2-enyl-diphosphate synthase [Elusimicrobia bacterium]|nr:(E)-4-hydroxy-3-methylbut-2-enyl-diphosphate synthase [Elusimicrobiota bacterium]
MSSLTASPPEKTSKLKHCLDLFSYQRRKTRELKVGRVGVGGDNPIRVQSMTTTDTLNTETTIAQTLRMVEAGCEIVRITAPTVEDARNLGRIKEGLLQRGVDVPLVADIHFQPKAAMEAAEWVEKVRINPGNFVDSKRFAVREYSDAEYADELKRIEDAFTPLVEKLKRLHRALRIGTNHGSLSDRIMNRYGDTPLGMVESALEYAQICVKNDFHSIIFSMKASNPKVMIQAYRLLAARLDELGMNYPFHLGVTEAGGGEDGRIKSAIGIGSLLEDGIGDTIRVSLTEDPEFEMPVAYAIARSYQDRFNKSGSGEVRSSKFEVRSLKNKISSLIPHPLSLELHHCPDLFQYERRKTDVVAVGPFPVGGPSPVRVVTHVPPKSQGEEILVFLEQQLKDPKSLAPEIIEWLVKQKADLEALKKVRAHLVKETSRLAFLVRVSGPLSLVKESMDHAHLISWLACTSASEGKEFLERAKSKNVPVLLETRKASELVFLQSMAADLGIRSTVGLYGGDPVGLLKEYRLVAALLAQKGLKAPLHIRIPQYPTELDQILQASLVMGGLLCDGIGDSVELEGVQPPQRNLELLYNILQGAGARVVKTEFVSCPSCGRTLFDLQSTTERIRSQTGHLKGVKIAIMGCIVNGPGEMADADFGYVGGAPDKINLYVGKDCVLKGVPTEKADQALIDLIKSHGKWVEP